MHKAKPLLLLLVFGLLVGCSALWFFGKQNRERIIITLYFSDDQAMYVRPERRTVPSGTEPLPSLLVKELIAGPKHKALHKTLPPETKLLGLEVKDGIAYVDLSQEVATKHWGGSAGEAMTVASVVNTLTELPEITSVQFLIEGEVQEAIWGHGVTSEPIARLEQLIGK